MLSVMQTAVSALASRTKLLDPSQLDQVESRLAVVQQRLTQIAEKKDVLEQSGKLNKVFSLVSCSCFMHSLVATGVHRCFTPGYWHQRADEGHGNPPPK